MKYRNELPLEARLEKTAEDEYPMDTIEKGEEEEIQAEQEDALPFTGSSLSVLPETSLESPYEISLAPAVHPMVLAINSPLVGLVQHPDPIAKPLRNALFVAKAWGYPVVLLTGNILHLDTTRAGKFQGFRAFVSDTNASTPLFEGVEKRLHARLKTLREQMTDKNGDPIFPGVIYTTFGRSEDEIINYWVNEKVNRTVVAERERIVYARKTAKSEIKTLEKVLIWDINALNNPEITPEEKDHLEKAIEQNEKKLAGVKEAVVELEYERVIISATNISEAVRKQWFLEAQKHLIDLFEAHVPGIKVIATGNCVMRVGGRLIRIEQNPRQTISDTFSDLVQNETRSRLKNGKNVPDLILLAGYSICGAYFRVNYPKSMDDPNEITSVHVVQLPMCIDASFLQRIADLSVRVGPFLTRLITSEYFTPGIVPCGWIANFFTSHPWWNRDIAPHPPEKKEGTSLAYSLFAEPEKLTGFFKTLFMFYKESESDMQEGGKQQAYYDIEEPPFRLAPYQFHHDFFLKIGAPIHHYSNLGDIVQGENHTFYHLEISEKYREPYKVKRYIEEILEADIPVEEKLRKLGQCAVQNAWRVGIQRIDMQLEQYIQQAYYSGGEYFARVLRNCKRTGLTFIGRAAPITILGGNHFGNTEGVGRHFNEAEICEGRLRAVLRDHHRLSREDVNTLVLAPLGSARTVSRILGAFGFNGVYPYCLSAKHKPGRGGARYQNPVKKMRAVRVRIGTTEPIYRDRFVLEEAGHIDRDAWCMIPNGFISLSPGQEFQGPYAEEEDFALADMGTKVIGLPAPAFQCGSNEVFGPLVHISFAYEVFYKYIKKPWKIDVKSLFPNAL
ncbi:MAG: hypothetical protein HYT37_03905 [Candidatus Sungbacteria bacterium]|nr:hypothetical protein [Candidatus Sungbacteria bacterium]